jgi:hypothetical protein
MSNTELLVFGASCPTTGRLSSQMLERHLQADHLSLIGMRVLERDKACAACHPPPLGRRTRANAWQAGA